MIDMEQQGSAAVTDSVDRAGIRFLEMREEASRFVDGRGGSQPRRGCQKIGRERFFPGTDILTSSATE